MMAEWASKKTKHGVTSDRDFSSDVYCDRALLDSIRVATVTFIGHIVSCKKLSLAVVTDTHRVAFAALHFSIVVFACGFKNVPSS